MKNHDKSQSKLKNIDALSEYSIQNYKDPTQIARVIPLSKNNALLKKTLTILQRPVIKKRSTNCYLERS